MSNKKKTVVISGGFDPVHIGHVRLIKEAKKLGDKLIVILNNDNWLKKKKMHIFMHQKERKEILESIDGVDQVIVSSHLKNTKDMSVIKELLLIKPDIFANGGDRKAEKDIPEAETCRHINCEMVFNVGRGGKIQSSSWLLKKYINKVRPNKKIKIRRLLNELKFVLNDSRVRIPLDVKLKIAEIMLKLMNKKAGFGLFIVIGWKDKWRKFTDMPDIEQDIYVKHHINILKHQKSNKYDIGATINFDGAILINSRGDIIQSGVIIEGLRPKVIANKINPGHFQDLSEQFGFKMKAHSRHLSAITASYVFKNTTVMTVSEENNSFHVFEGGRILYRLL